MERVHFAVQFNFCKAHIAGELTASVDFQYRSRKNVIEKINFKVHKAVPTELLEVEMGLTGIAQEYSVFITT